MQSLVMKRVLCRPLPGLKIIQTVAMQPHGKERMLTKTFTINKVRVVNRRTVV